MDATAIIAAIMDGSLDDARHDIQDALLHRGKQLREARSLINRVTLVTGTRVRTKGLKPKYLNGLTGTVDERPTRRPGDLSVTLDEGQYTGRYGRKISLPASCLERAE